MRLVKAIESIEIKSNDKLKWQINFTPYDVLSKVLKMMGLKYNFRPVLTVLKWTSTHIIGKSFSRETTVKRYKDPVYTFQVRGKDINIKTHSESLSHTQIPKVALPKYRSWGDILRWLLLENVPGEYPYTAGIYPFKREGEDLTRMFAGGWSRTHEQRFYYVSLGMPAKRLSTAFDSVTLYGNDPDRRPDIYGKIGNSGVSICC